MCVCPAPPTPPPTPPCLVKSLGGSFGHSSLVSSRIKNHFDVLLFAGDSEIFF